MFDFQLNGIERTFYLKKRFDPQILGGESILLDSFEVAEEFREKYPKYFEGIFILTKDSHLK